ncbi:D-alanyl-D-alanine carboxypeptidase/D-alanyl-D-alanine-endopeptidase [Gulosibacter hominis]|uniref:D-alanyl-D-alanine carboxypeptidase/D-alanyl-D-alanine-endopeptidase n=1 Tax=Gulosibacter hominis TaxID=2770504 RepID=UPI0019194EDB|nr:D-alanyl-D-alanine carboxypeptidase [Gulosibacter hominis]
MADARMMRWLGGAAALITGLSLGAASTLIVPATSAVDVSTTSPTPTPEPAPLQRADFRKCSLQPAIDAAGDLTVHATFTDDATGQLLAELHDDEPVPTASVMKLVTAATAYEVLGPDYRLTTRVVPGTKPGTVVLVGGGDPTLRSGDGSYFPGTTASINDLVDQLGNQRITAVGIDTSRYTGPQWQPSWEPEDRTLGYMSPISALMVDGSRADPTAQESPRSEAPASDAGNVFASRVGASLDPSLKPAPGAMPLAAVESPTVAELVDLMLLESDNVIAEVLAREVAIKLDTGTDFDAINQAQRRALLWLGVDVTGFVGADGSGLSRDNRASAETIDELLRVVSTHDELAPLLAGLPESQRTGTLERRFPELADGAVNAKTGQITESLGLAGWIDVDGGRVRMVVMVTRPVGGENAPVSVGVDRPLLDSVVARAQKCGLQLSGQ